MRSFQTTFAVADDDRGSIEDDEEDEEEDALFA